MKFKPEWVDAELEVNNDCADNDKTLCETDQPKDIETSDSTTVATITPTPAD